MAMKDGGPAYPTFELERVYLDDADRLGRMTHVPVGGMSLRDYFAGQALIGLLSCDLWVKGLDDTIKTQPGQFKPYVAAHAYLLADAMLKAREATRD